MPRPEPGEEAADEAVGKAKQAANSRKKHSASKAKADLEEEVERLTVSRNTERFLLIITAIIAFDAWVFTLFNTWASPICLVVIEIAGLFVLARYLEVIEVVYFMLEIVRAAGRRESDPEGDA